MKVNFDNLRRHIARSFNELSSEILELKRVIPSYEIEYLENLIEKYNNLHNDIWPLMCIYDTDSEFNDLSDTVKLNYINLGDE